MGSALWTDYYELLGIPFDADEDTIKRAYRNKMREWHPDNFANESAEKQNEAQEKTKKYNEAYEVLSNKEKKKEYDSTYEVHKNGTCQDNDDTIYGNSGSKEEAYADVDYEEVKKTYTEEETRYAEKLAAKSLIEEELKKVDEILRVKNELAYNASYGLVTEEEFHAALIEFLGIVGEYENNLNSLMDLAKKYELLDEIDTINQVKELIHEELDKMPRTVGDAKFYVKKEEYRKNVLHELEELTETSEVAIHKLSAVLQYAYSGEITDLDYTSIKATVVVEAENIKSRLNQVIKVLKLMDLNDEYEKAVDLFGRLNSKILLMPNCYEAAKQLGENESIKDKLKETLQAWEINYKKYTRMIELLQKYPDSSLYNMVFKACSSILDSGIQTLGDIYDDANSKKSTVKGEIRVYDFYNETIKVYDSAEELHSQARVVYDNVISNNQGNSIGQFDAEIMEILEKTSLSLEQKLKFLETLVEIGKILKTQKAMKAAEDDPEFVNLLQSIKNTLMTIDDEKRKFNSKFKLQKKAGPYKSANNSTDSSKFLDRINTLQRELIKAYHKRIAAQAFIITVCGFGGTKILYEVFTGDSEYRLLKIFTSMMISIVLACLGILWHNYTNRYFNYVFEKLKEAKAENDSQASVKKKTKK